MTHDSPPKRKYDSSRRKDQARETRHQIAEAARSLFIKRGYSGTTIDAIAQEAGVAPETVYAIFSNKRKILSHLMDISIGGDEQPIRLLDRPEPRAVLHDTDQQHQIMMISQGISEIMGRVAHLFEIMRSAAKTEQDIEDLLNHLLNERLENMTTFVQNIANNGGLREGMEVSAAAELVWTITSPEVFLLLTRDRNFSQEQYAAWLQTTLVRLLLP
ncbi:MAG TPA: helix-turn-helix domain-containing protein [Anaerolineaceae bacterium]|jgi:TetR/AcrR family transcriptional regulator of autoinduction and epiphytic fitness